MNQLGRRVTYLSFGLLPACLGTTFSFFLGPLMLVALAGTYGLFFAMAIDFPIQGKRYWFMAGLLGCGLALALPFGLGFSYAFFANGPSPKNLPGLIFVWWIFLCPSACAIHALWRGRGAPNPSSEPPSLRDAT